MRQLRCGAGGDEGLWRDPLALVIAYLLAPRANRDETREGLPKSILKTPLSYCPQPVCARVVDVDCAVGSALCLTPAEVMDYEIDEAEVIYWGRCPECRARARTDSEL